MNHHSVPPVDALYCIKNVVFLSPELLLPHAQKIIRITLKGIKNNIILNSLFIILLYGQQFYKVKF